MGVADTYWGKMLCPFPQPFVPVLSGMEHVKTIGFLLTNQTMPTNNTRQFLDSDLTVDLKGRGFEFDEDSYRVMLPTHQGAFNATRRFDREPSLVLDPEVLSYAKADLMQYYSPFFETCPMAREEELTWNRKSSPGHFFKEVYGARNTGEVLDSEAMMDEMRDFHMSPHYPTLWTAAVKEELLPAQKIADNIPRTFIIPDKRLHYHSMMLFHTQHELFVRLGQNLNMEQTCGYSFFKRGFSNLMDRLREYKYILEGDASKWDSSLRYVLFKHFVIPVRIKLFKPLSHGQMRHESIEEFGDSVHQVYRDMVFAYVRLPNGQVILIKLGMKSGWFGTSDDNTLIHQGVVRMVMRMVILKYNVEIEALWKLFSDDHIAGTNCEQITHYSLRSSMYAECGIVLKQEADFVSNTPEGHTFLGFKARFSVTYGCYVPVFNVCRLLCMLVRPKKRLSKSEQFARINACRILAFFTPQRDLFSQLARDYWSVHHVEQNPYLPGSVEWQEYADLCQVWTDSEVEALWLGYECSGDGLKTSLLKHDSFQSQKECYESATSCCASGACQGTTALLETFCKEGFDSPEEEV